MKNSRQISIDPKNVKTPWQFMAVWFISLIILNASFLTAATVIKQPDWIVPTLVISSILLVPIFLLIIFLLQTTYRENLLDDDNYLKHQDSKFKNFTPENLSNNQQDFTSQIQNIDLEELRIVSYRKNQGLFLVHAWRPSISPDQVADIAIWLHQHGKGPLTEDKIEKVEYELGRKFFSKPVIKQNSKDSFLLQVSAYDSMLCKAKVYFKGDTNPLLLDRYINFK